MRMEDISTLISTLTERDRLSEDEISVLQALNWREKAVRPESEIVPDRSKPRESCLLLEGICARAAWLQSGERQITALHVPGDFVDLHGLYLRIMDHSVIALTTCRLGFVEHSALVRITEDHPHLGRVLATMVAIDAAIQRNWILSLGRRKPESRLAHLICELFLRLKTVGRTHGTTLALPISQGTLADVLGLSIVHTNRTIQHLRSTNLVTWRGGEITITDWDGLCELGEFDPIYLNLFREAR